MLTELSFWVFNVVNESRMNGGKLSAAFETFFGTM